MVYIAIHILNPHVQRVWKMCGKGGYRVSKAELWTAEVDPYLEYCGSGKRKAVELNILLGIFFLQKI